MARRTQVDLGFAEKEVSLTTIATELGVSISTVSRALRGRPGIHPLTRQRILDRAAALGYTRHTGPNGEGPATTIMVLSRVTSSGIDDGYLAGMSHLASTCNSSILYQHYREEECETLLDPARRPGAFKAGAVDGIILIYRWPETVARALAAERPLISIVHEYPGLENDVITIDDRHGTELLVRQLCECGHNRIAFFGLCPEITWSRSRFGSYVEELVFKELTLDLGCVIKVDAEDALAEGLISVEKYKDAILSLIDKGVTAFACASDMLGYGLLNGLHSWGIKVPNDVAVTGFHSDLRGVLAGLPLLTSTQLSTQDLGAAALRRLLNRLKNPEEINRSVVLPCKLLVGKTTVR